jgi:hypothetical protein
MSMSKKCYEALAAAIAHAGNATRRKSPPFPLRVTRRGKVCHGDHRSCGGDSVSS